MTNTNLSSLSQKKQKRGLSLSLEKKKKQKNLNQQTGSIFKQQSIRKSYQSVDNSSRKNKIKFVESYNKNESGSKFKKSNYFKISDQDIKLGGNKKISGHQRKILQFSNNNCFNQYKPGIDTNSVQYINYPISSQRKGLRESKVVNLTSNINYFQGLGIKKQNQFYCSHFGQQKLQLKEFKFNATQPIKVLETLQQKKHQDSELKQSLIQSLMTQRKQNQRKQSTNKFTLQKLKKVQNDIDQLLAKASQTRALILR